MEAMKIDELRRIVSNLSESEKKSLDVYPFLGEADFRSVPIPAIIKKDERNEYKLVFTGKMYIATCTYVSNENARLENIRGRASAVIDDRKKAVEKMRSAFWASLDDEMEEEEKVKKMDDWTKTNMDYISTCEALEKAEAAFSNAGSKLSKLEEEAKEYNFNIKDWTKKSVGVDLNTLKTIGAIDAPAASFMVEWACNYSSSFNMKHVGKSGKPVVSTTSYLHNVEIAMIDASITSTARIFGSIIDTSENNKKLPAQVFAAMVECRKSLEEVAHSIFHGIFVNENFKFSTKIQPLVYLCGNVYKYTSDRKAGSTSRELETSLKVFKSSMTVLLHEYFNM